MEKINLRFKQSSEVDSTFWREVKQEVNQYFKNRQISKKGNSAMVFKTVTFLSLTLGSYFLILSNWFSPLMMLGLIVLISVGISGIGFCIAHDALHGAYSKNNKINRILSFSMDLIGMNSYLWHLKHNVAHHTYTNIHEFDEDIRGVKLICFSPYSPRHTFHKYQYLYAFPVYTMVYFNMVFLHNFKQFFQKDFGPYRNIEHSIDKWIHLFLGKALFVLYTIVIPLLILDIPLWQFIIGYILMGIITGVIMGTVFSLAHIVEEVDFPLPNDQNYIEDAWAVHQLKTTNNFAMNNKVLTWFIGGLNHQIEHHLFPSICSVHYPRLSKIVKSKADKYNIPYHCSPTLWDALKSHCYLLKKLGVKEKELINT